MSNFTFTKSHQFTTDSHSFSYLGSNRIEVEDENGSILFECDLNSETTAIMGEVVNGEMNFCFGTVSFTGESFTKSIGLNENKQQFGFEPADLDVIGSDDLRDVRIASHTYHLNGIPILLESDGVFLTVKCPGSEESPWYEST